MKSTNQITELEFISELKNKGFSYVKHQSMSGSQYWTIEGVKYRVSDHFNPNVSNDDKIEVSFHCEILSRLESDIKNLKNLFSDQEYIFDEELDAFVLNPKFNK